MAACSPSRYVAEVRAVSNPNFAYSKDKTAQMAGKVVVCLQAVEASAGKDFSDLFGLAGTNFNNNMPERQQVISRTRRNRTIAIQSVHPAIQRARRVPLANLWS